MSKVATYAEYLSTIAEEVNAMKTSWSAKPYSRWANYDFHMLKSIMGVKETPKTNLYWAPTVGDVSNDIPAEFNAGTQWPLCTSIVEVRD